LIRLKLPKHTPFLNGKGGVDIGLKPIEGLHWLEVDNKYVEEMAVKKKLLSIHRNKVLQASPQSLPAQAEMLECLLENLSKFHAHSFSVSPDKKNLYIKETNESLPLKDKQISPIETASLIVQEDLVLMIPRGNKFYLEAASLNAPSHWSLVKKFSKSLLDLHEGVPDYKDQIGERVNGIFKKLPVDRILERYNWSIYDNPELYQPAHSKPQVDIHSTDPKDLFLRVERQTIRKLPSSNSVLFTIRVHVDPLLSIKNKIDLLIGLEQAILNLSPQMKEYKAINQIEDSVLKWIRTAKNK